MSKVVKSVGRGLTKVLKGAGKLISKLPGGKFVTKAVSKTLKALRESKVGRILAVAAAVYFTGGAALGAIGTIGTSTSMIAGASAGLSSAWAGVAGAGSALFGTATAASGGATGLAGAANALGAGWAGAAGAGASLASGAATTGAAMQAAAAGAGQGFGAAMTSAGQSLGIGGGGDGAGSGGTWVTDPVTGLKTLPSEAVPAAANASTGGNLLTSALKSGGGSAMWQAASGALQAGGQAYSQNKAEEYDREKTEEERRRYNANMGGRMNIFEQFRSGRPA